MFDLRTDLAEAKIALRQARDDYQTRKAIVEYTVLLAGGPNKEARDAAAAHALREDASVVEALGTLRDAEAQIDRLEAALLAAEDSLKERRLAAQERQTAALGRFADALGRVPPAVAAAATGLTEEWAGR